MRAVRIHDYWKDANGYCRSIILITYKFSIDDIIKCGKDVVLFGWVPHSSIVIKSLNRVGVNVKYVCDVKQSLPVENSKGVNVGEGLILRDYRELIKENKKYYFLFFSEDDSLDIYSSGLIKQVRLLQYEGVEEFGIISDVRTRDIYGNSELLNSIYETVNEIFSNASMYNWGAYGLCRSQAGIDFQNWDYPLCRLLEMYNDKPKPTFLEIGPGIGVLSLTLKKQMDIDITWLNVPDEEPQWNAWRDQTSLNLFDKYNIHINEAYVETDDFDGSYDIIFMSQVIEHFVYNPVPTIKRLMTHLNDEGVMFISTCGIIYNTPKNVDSYKEIPYYQDISPREATRRRIVNGLTHFHEYEYKEGLELFEECGLECIDSHVNQPILHYILKKK